VGWFSKIIAPVLKVGAGVFLGEAGASIVGEALGLDEPVEELIQKKAAVITGGRKGGISPGPLPISATVEAVKAGLTPAQAVRAQAMPTPGLPGVVAPGGLKNVVRTIVQTIAPNGQIVASEMLAGRPFLMQKDIVTAKRVFKQSRKLASKIPKKTVRESPTTQLKDRVIQQAMQNLLCAPACPPPACPR